LLIAYLNLDVSDPHRAYRGSAQARAHQASSVGRAAEAILETKLRHLARLEEMKIRDEQKELAEERDEIEGILKSKARLTRCPRRNA